MNTKTARLIELGIVLLAVIAPQVPQSIMCNHFSSDEAGAGLVGSGISVSIIAVYRMWNKRTAP